MKREDITDRKGYAKECLIRLIPFLENTYKCGEYEKIIKIFEFADGLPYDAQKIDENVIRSIVKNSLMELIK